jgi:hypothetical protein
MYSLALFIVELQTAKRRLITVFEEPDGTSKQRTRNAPNFQRSDIGRTVDAPREFGCGHFADLSSAAKR